MSYETSGDTPSGDLQVATLRRRDFLWSLEIATGIQLALFLATDIGSLLEIRALVRLFRGPGAGSWVPVLPYALAAAQIVFFYILLGVVMGALLYGVARVLASRRASNGTWIVPRRRYYAVFLAAVLIVTSYMYLHALLLYPALFDCSWVWAALAGSPGVVMVVGLSGKIGAIVVCLVVFQKRREAIQRWLRRRAWLPAAALAIVACAAGVRWWLSRPATANRGPNVIVILLESIRPDHVSGLGYTRTTTPNLDKFLRDSIVFTNAFVPLARTEPSWLSILTGCLPARHGRRCDLAPKELRVPPVPTLGGQLQGLGYRTSFFLDNTNFTWMDPEIGFSHIGQPKPNLIWFTLSYFHIHLVMYYYCLNNVVGFLYAPMLRANEGFSAVYDWRPFARDIERYLVRMTRQEKFFLMAHTCILSAPFSLAYPCSTFFAPPAPVPPNRFVFRWPVDAVLSDKEFDRRISARLRPQIFSQEINLYDALVRETDDWLGTVLDSIRRLGLYDNSLIIVASDHGEDLWRNDHAYPYVESNHGNHVWGDDSYRIVLAVKLPKSKCAGRQVPWLVRSIDIAPTVLDALGLPALPGTDGISLLPQIENPARDPGLSAYSEAGVTMEGWLISGHRQYPFEHLLQFQYVDRPSLRIYRKQEYMAGFVMAKDRALRDSRWKIVAYPMAGDGPVPFKTSLHNVESDPTNRVDLSTSEPVVLAEMRARLAPYIEADARLYGFKWQWQDRPAPTVQATSAPLGREVKKER
jgi:arylsulfatase A-like enzyme